MMKLVGLHIDRFGPWRDLDLEFSGQGMTVLCGPNGCGKSTLARFVRGILFGFPPSPSSHPAPGGPRPSPPHLRRGHLVLSDGKTRFELHRAAPADGQGVVRIVGPENPNLPGSHLTSDTLAAHLGPLDDELFRQAFLVTPSDFGATNQYDHARLVDKIFRLSVGPRGRALDGFREALGQDAASDLPPRLAELWDRHQAVCREMHRQREVRAQYDESVDSWHAAKCRVAAAEDTLDGLRRELRGLRLVAKAAPLWQQLSEVERELAELPPLVGFPGNAVERLEDLESQIADARGCREALLADARELAVESGRLELPAHHVEALSVARHLLDDRARLDDADRQLAHATEHLHAQRQHLADQLSSLGPDWTPARLSQLDRSPTAGLALRRLGRIAIEAYESVAQNRQQHRQLVDQIERLRDTLQQDILAISNGDHALSVPLDSASSITRAIDEMSRRLDHLATSATLSIRIAELRQRRVSLDEEWARTTSTVQLPRPVRMALAGFGASGAGLSIAGFASGLLVNGLIGSAVAMLGVICLVGSWCVDRFSRQRSATRTEELARLLDETDARLVEAETACEHLGPVGSDASDIIHRTTRQIGQLERLLTSRQELEHLETSEQELSNHLESLQRRATVAFGDWRQQVTAIGLDDLAPAQPEDHTRRDAIDALISLYRAALDLAPILDSIARAEDEQGRLVADQSTWLRRIESAEDAMPRWLSEPDGLDASIRNGSDDRHPMSRLQVRVDQAETRRQRSQALRESRRDRRREAADYAGRITTLESQVAALMVQAGALDAAELRHRAVTASRVSALASRQTQLNEELSRIGGQHGDIAIDPRQLTWFDAEGHQQEILRLTRRVDELVAEIESATASQHESHATRLRLETDRNCQQLSRQREAIRGQIREETRHHIAARWLHMQVGQLQADYETHHQPRALELASSHLAALSRGRYQRAWCPISSRQLVVDDSSGHGHLAESLSSGDLVQLHLAVRLAVAQQLTEEGVSMPLMLDDVLAECDQSSRSAAVEVLGTWAEEVTQVIVMTRDTALASEFSDAGHSVINLPSADSATKTRRAG